MFLCAHLCICQVPQCKDSGGWRTQYLLPGLWVLPVGASACDRECGFQRDGPTISTVWHQGKKKNIQIIQILVFMFSSRLTTARGILVLCFTLFFPVFCSLLLFTFLPVLCSVVPPLSFTLSVSSPSLPTLSTSPYLLQAFVENNPAIRWCPAARCERAVRLTRPGPGDSDPQSFPLLPSPAVDCGKGHLFCWYMSWFIGCIHIYIESLHRYKHLTRFTLNTKVNYCFQFVRPTKYLCYQKRLLFYSSVPFFYS